MNPLDEKLTSPRCHSYVHHVPCTTLSKPTRWISRSILSDNPRLLFRDPISPLLFLWSYVQLTVKVVYNITKSKLDGFAISIVASSEPPHLGVDVLNFFHIFYQGFYTIDTCSLDVWFFLRFSKFQLLKYFREWIAFKRSKCGIVSFASIIYSIKIYCIPVPRHKIICQIIILICESNIEDRTEITNLILLRDFISSLYSSG